MKSPMKFILPFDKVIATTKGHTIEFKAGVPTAVPPDCWNEVRGQGAVAEDQKAVEVAQAKVVKPVSDDPEQREAAIITAFETLIESNKRGDFDPTGSPSLKKVEGLVGFDVDIKERDTLWAKFKVDHKL